MIICEQKYHKAYTLQKQNIELSNLKTEDFISREKDRIGRGKRRWCSPYVWVGCVVRSPQLLFYHHSPIYYASFPVKLSTRDLMWLSLLLAKEIDYFGPDCTSEEVNDNNKKNSESTDDFRPEYQDGSKACHTLHSSEVWYASVPWIKPSIQSKYFRLRLGQ